MNKDGYKDPTADDAVRNASRVPKHVRDVFRALQTVESLHGYEITGLRDKKIGKVYRWF